MILLLLENFGSWCTDKLNAAENENKERSYQVLNKRFHLLLMSRIAASMSQFTLGLSIKMNGLYICYFQYHHLLLHLRKRNYATWCCWRIHYKRYSTIPLSSACLYSQLTPEKLEIITSVGLFIVYSYSIRLRKWHQVRIRLESR